MGFASLSGSSMSLLRLCVCVHVLLRDFHRLFKKEADSRAKRPFSKFCFFLACVFHFSCIYTKKKALYSGRKSKSKWSNGNIISIIMIIVTDANVKGM